ncbi:Receptor-type guanylate cyclase gcy-6 [Caenorhabditis elegans]|uniref:Isoform b of Receptor-type guanylate cyclase gcy-6 n=1 Tax=Caenorhabditis elegans TaxID=6239 RepID=N1NVB7-2|nr:Receptor-type guanylate cyclase gcy-6 [Caenorhabditis elegans]CAA94879.4 Receptor-type guanylate cyclase gcy-6 [Caenorhabditis elegans]|eukprot:NP_505650.3 Receptor-type guanylate cyclase gcy-6 [Caenorhabditis elegans]
MIGVYLRSVIFPLLFVIQTICQPPGNVFHLGFLHCDNVEGSTTYINYRTSASAASIAIDKIKREGLLLGYDFKFTILYDQCDENIAAGNAIKLFAEHNVDVLFGPTTNNAAMPVFILATYYNIPLITWGITSSATLDDESRFPTAGMLSIGSRSLAVTFREVMKEYGWDQFVFAYSLEMNDEKCETLRDDFQNMVAYYGDIVLSYAVQIMDHSEEGLLAILKDVSTRGRIIVPCFHEGNSRGLHRRWMLVAARNGFVNDEYVYIFPSLRSRGYAVPQADGTFRYPWTEATGPQPGDQEALLGFQKSIFIVDMQGQGNVGSNYTQFEHEIIQRMKEPPYNCTDACASPEYQTAATYAGQLHDSVYIYGVVMDQIMKTVPNQYKNGTAFPRKMAGVFNGVGGTVAIDEGGGLQPTLFVLTLDSNNNSSLIMTVDVDQQEAVVTKHYTNEATALWSHRKGIRPPDQPICGYTGSLCPANVFFQYIGWFIAAIIIIFFTIMGAILAFIYLCHAKQQEVERQNALWQIPFKSMMTVTKKGKGEHSMRSISSVPSTISSTRSSTLSEVGETRNYLFFQIQNDVEMERVAAKKHSIRMVFDNKTCATMRQMRLIDHANLNKFIGMSLDAPQLYSVWRFCSRGSLADVIRKASMQMDGFFIYSLMKDIINGLTWIHESSHEFHGMLTSKNCLLNDRWQLKITDFGLRIFRTHDQYNKSDRLWTSPELLRTDDILGSREGDIYSFGIISAELITRSSVFDLENRKEDAEEIIYMLKKGGLQSPRPSLEHDESIEINPALLHLVRDCWTERPSERPDIKQVASQLRSMNTNRNDNLMDHVFNVLESYASTLEDEVAERMKELVEEKKKSDVLLYRMLPRQVADKLKLGQTVEPETFDIVTLFFSDVVSFTTLAGKCTPLQVVNLLNGLYTIFDGIIEQHDVYKVETIGDGYFVASGVPRRNGNEHTRNIASMSINFVKSLADFSIPHLPGEKIKIRVGFHCGSVVAGVVGLTMPRYCLFGDAVNTASRMESNSKPGQIHLSEEANQMLMRLGGFTTEPRGEVIIKGKGVMATYWLLKMDESAAPKILKKKQD